MINKKAFSLIELLVVTMVLTFLMLIGFVSVTGYLGTARDSARMVDIDSMESGLELYKINRGSYPLPSNQREITYNGATAWIQGTFGESVVRPIVGMDFIPLDPLLKTEYAYSKTAQGDMYQIGGIMEGSELSVILPTYAKQKKATALVRGTYNQKFINVFTGGLDYILSVPSILTNDILAVDVSEIINSQKLIFNGYQNLPPHFAEVNYDINGGFPYISNNIVAYQGKIEDLYTNPAKRIQFISDLQKSYRSSILETNPKIEEILAYDTYRNAPSYKSQDEIATFIGKHFKDQKIKEGKDKYVEPWKNLVCEDMTQTQIDTLNSWYGNVYSLGTWCSRTSLSLRFKGLTSVPKEIGYLNNLRTLDLSNNSIEILPKEIGSLSKLTSLSVDFNNLAELPTELGYLTNLTYLSFRLNDITNFPSEIGDLTQLTELHLDYNNIPSIPTSIGNLALLKILHVYNNKVTNFPSSIGNLTELTDLRLNYNLIPSIPSSIGNLGKVTDLYLDNNQITSIPTEIGSLTGLTYLSLHHNQISSIPSEIGSLVNLRALYVNNNLLTSITPEIFSLTELGSLSLSANSITVLPSGIGNLINLGYLNLSLNQIDIVPAEIGNLVNLTSLYFSHNQFTTLPAEFGNLINLSFLTLNDGQLTALPPEIGNLVNLSYLYLGTNKIASFPAEIGNLSNLTYLSAGANKLTVLPTEIGNISNLKKLYLYQNQLTQLPSEFGNLINLTTLDLRYMASLGTLSTSSFNPAKSQTNVTPLGETITIDGTVSPFIITVTP